MGAFHCSKAKLPLISKSLPMRLTTWKLMSLMVVPPCRGRPGTRDEIFRGFLISHAYLNPLVTAEVIAIQPWPPLASRPIQSPKIWPLLV